MTALQGQEPAAPYVALWNRVHGFDPDDLDDAFTSGRLVKATLMRVTLHIVTVADHATFRGAMLHRLRAARLHDRRFREHGLTPADADELVEDLLAVTDRPRTPAEVLEALAERRGGEVHPQLWWALRTYGPLVRAPNGRRWGFAGDTSYLRAPVADEALPARDAAVRGLVRRYLEGFGPASVADVARFSLLTRASVAAAVAELGDELVVHDGPDGRRLLDVVDGALPDPDTPAPPRLLGMWDSTLLAYHDRGRIVADEHRAEVIRRNGDTLPVVLVDGRVRGVWRQLAEGIEVTPFGPIGARDWDLLAGEAAALLTMLRARDDATFGRYHRWWQRLPDDGRRLLGASPPSVR